MQALMSLVIVLAGVGVGVGHARELDPNRWRLEKSGPFHDVKVAPDGQTVVLRTETRAIRSVDGGKTFAEILSGPGEMTALELDRQGRVWVVRDGKLGRLDASGETWRPIGVASSIGPIAVDGDVVVIAGQDTDPKHAGDFGMFVSKDGGQTFAPRRQWSISDTLEFVVRDGTISHVTGPEDLDDGYQRHAYGSVDAAQLTEATIENGTPVHDGAIEIGACGGAPGVKAICLVSDGVTLLKDAPRTASGNVWVAVAEAGARRFVKVGSRFFEVKGGKLTLVAERRIEMRYHFGFVAAEDGTLWVVDTGSLFRFDKGWKRVEPSLRK